MGVAVGHAGLDAAFDSRDLACLHKRSLIASLDCEEGILGRLASDGHAGVDGS
jgi:hypothetical protein